jgi:hypothetical protein
LSKRNRRSGSRPRKSIRRKRADVRKHMEKKVREREARQKLQPSGGFPSSPVTKNE